MTGTEVVIYCLIGTNILLVGNAYRLHIALKLLTFEFEFLRFNIAHVGAPADDPRTRSIQK